MAFAEMEPTVDEAARMANEAAATQPFFNQRRHGKRKKKNWI